MRKWIALGLALCSNPALATVAILNDGDHAAPDVVTGVQAISTGALDVTVFADKRAGDRTGFTFNLSEFTNATPNIWTQINTGALVNHHPYRVGNTSTLGYSPTEEMNYYAAAVAQGAIVVQPLAATIQSFPPNTYPPAMMLVASSPNSGNGGTGWGIELGLPVSYKGVDTSEDSWVSGNIAGMFGVLLQNHPTWNIWDAKAALRITASKWATGYDHTAFGYGLIDWDTANAGPATLYLQPPALIVQNHQWYGTVVLLPFRQTRRDHEVVYSVAPGTVLPTGRNEYSAADIAGLGGTLLYTSNGTDVIPTFTYAPLASGTVTLIAFTVDSTGTVFSRGEEFSKQSSSFTVGQSCNK